MSLYDGHLSIQGMDAGTDELLLPRSLAAMAINRTFRKGNKTRPLIREHKLTFDSQSTENAIAGGVLTGAKEYSPWRNLVAGVSVDSIATADVDRMALAYPVKITDNEFTFSTSLSVSESLRGGCYAEIKLIGYE